MNGLDFKKFKIKLLCNFKMFSNICKYKTLGGKNMDQIIQTIESMNPEDVAVGVGVVGMNAEEIDILQARTDNMIKKALEHEKGLEFLAQYQCDFDYDYMKKYIMEHQDEYKSDEKFDVFQKLDK